jgi:hypothetical protein
VLGAPRRERECDFRFLTYLESLLAGSRIPLTCLPSPHIFDPTATFNHHPIYPQSFFLIRSLLSNSTASIYDALHRRRKQWQRHFRQLRPFGHAPLPSWRLLCALLFTPSLGVAPTSTSPSCPARLLLSPRRRRCHSPSNPRRPPSSPHQCPTESV